MEENTNKKFLNIETGIKTFVLKPSDTETGEEEVSVRFNPTDTNFAQQIYNTFEELSETEDSYQKRLDESSGTAEVFTVSRELDKVMREKINALFGKDVCTAIAGETNMYAMAGGMPIWANLVLAIFDEMEDTFSVEQKLHSQKMKKYTEKYSTNRSKYHN